MAELEGPGQQRQVPSTPTLQTLSIELGSVVDWHSLGVKLGIKAHELKTIEKNHHGDAVRCKDEMLGCRLRSAKPLTWKAVADALCLMGEHAVALAIRTTYCSSSIATDTGISFAASPQDPVAAVARRNTQRIQWKFAKLVTKSSKILQSRNIKVEDVQSYLVAMYSSPDSRDGSDMVTTVLESAKTLDKIFCALTKYRVWDCLNYYLLQCIIEDFASDDDELNGMMEQYQQDLTGYALTLRMVQTYLDATHYEHFVAITCDSESPSNGIVSTLSPQERNKLFKKLSFKIKAKITEHSLSYVNRLWQSLANQFALLKPAMILHSIAEGCISITWLIPTNLVKHVTRMAQETSDRFARKHILRVMLEEQCIYLMETKLETKPLLLQTESLLPKTKPPLLETQLDSGPAALKKDVATTQLTEDNKMAARTFRSEDANPLENVIIMGDDGDGIPLNEPLDLRKILNAPAVVETNAWKDVGLELGVKKFVLDKIDRDCQHQTDDCKREMFDCWLKTDGHKSLEEVNAAVKRAKKRLEGATIREESREYIRKQGKQTVNAINQVKESLERMDDMNRNIVHNQIKLEEELKEQKGKWEPFQTRCTKEDRKWNEGEQGRQQIKEALRVHNLQESKFVKEFLREKGLSKNLSNEEVECYLRRDLLEKEVARSRQIRSRCQRAQKLHEKLNYLLRESREWEELVEERAKQVYPRIVDSLKELGVKEEIFQALEQQLKKLTNTLTECRTAVENCDQALREGEDYLQNCEDQLREFSESFGEVVGRTGMVLRWLEDNVKQIIPSDSRSALAGSILGSLVGVSAAAEAGAVAGTVTLPLVGTIVGATVGGLVGLGVASSVREKKLTDEKKLRLEIETKQRTLQHCKKIEKQAKNELKELQKMLQPKI